MSTLNTNIFDLVGPATNGDYSQAVTFSERSGQSVGNGLASEFDNHLGEAIESQSSYDNYNEFQLSHDEQQSTTGSTNERARFSKVESDAVDIPKNEKSTVDSADQRSSERPAGDAVNQRSSERPASHSVDQKETPGSLPVKDKNNPTKPETTTNTSDRVNIVKGDSKSPKSGQVRSGSGNIDDLLMGRSITSQKIERLLQSQRTSPVIDKKEEQHAGQYIVESMKDLGGEVEIIARSTKSKTQQVKIVVSHEQLAQMVKGDSNTMVANALGNRNPVNRVPLNSPESSKPELDQLLEKLNLTELRVEITESNKNVASGGQSKKDELTLRFTLPETFGQWVVKGRHSKNRPNRNMMSRKSNSVAKDNSRPDVGDGAASGSKNATSVNPLLTNARISGVNKVLFKAPTNVAPELFAASETGNSENQSGQNISQVSQKSLGDNALKMEPMKVRFTLPDDISKNLKPDGKSVMLKIHPEILGPVRLKVRLQGEMLQARVLVDSAQVKAMVEGSISQLTEGLHRVGIKVDQVEVDVAGFGSGNELFGKETTWTKHKMKTNFDLSDERLIALQNEPQAVSVDSGYVSAGGVNVLA